MSAIYLFNWDTIILSAFMFSSILGILYFLLFCFDYIIKKIKTKKSHKIIPVAQVVDINNNLPYNENQVYIVESNN